MTKRILITGASGVGKTTLANELSKEFNILKIGVSIFDKIPPDLKGIIKTHEDLIRYCKLNPEKGASIQFETLLSRQILFGNHYNSGFVTDRGHIDSYVYTSLEVTPYLSKDSFWDNYIERFIRKVKGIHRLFTHIIYIPFVEDWVIENNGIRVVDTKFQKEVDGEYKRLLAPYINNPYILHDSMDMGPRVIELGERDLVKRIEVCKAFIG